MQMIAEKNKNEKTRKTVIFTGYSCNNNCVFCCHSHKRNGKLERTTDEILKDIHEARSLGSTYLEIIGGEPTIRKDFIRIVTFAKTLGFSTIMIATNGRMLSYKTYTESIIEAGINHIVFSIHGHNAEIHDLLTGAKGSFDQLLMGIENVKYSGLNHIGSNTTIVKQNYQHLPEIGNLIKSLGIQNSEFIFVDPTHGAPNEKFDELVPGYDEVALKVNNLLQFGKENSISHWDIRYYLLCKIDKQFFNQVSELNENKNFLTEHRAPDFYNNDASGSRMKETRTTALPYCEDCIHKIICEGPWVEYVKHRGAEFMKKNTEFFYYKG
jgi:MoaA/NifB/PqqE/SkfB family radical SAM enzyme